MIVYYEFRLTKNTSFLDKFNHLWAILMPLSCLKIFPVFHLKTRQIFNFHPSLERIPIVKDKINSLSATIPRSNGKFLSWEQEIKNWIDQPFFTSRHKQSNIALFSKLGFQMTPVINKHKTTNSCIWTFWFLSTIFPNEVSERSLHCYVVMLFSIWKDVRSNTHWQNIFT